MSKIWVTILLIFSILLITNCSTVTKLGALKPEPDDAVPLVYDNNPSFIYLPISVKIKDIETQTNELLKDLIYEDTTIEDDNLEIKIWKLAPITIKNDNPVKGEKIKTILPLKAIVRYRLGTKKMGIEMYDIREFYLNGVVTLISDVTLKNWKLNTKTELKSLEWNENPTMRIFGKDLPITYLIDPSIKIFKSKIETEIDNAIEKSMNFKPNVLAALEKICIPFKISDAYQTWFRIAPIAIYTTNAKLKKDTFVLEMGMKCNMETLIGKEPESKFNASNIILQPIVKIPEQLTANIVAISTYQEASKIITKNFYGQVFANGSKKVKVENVSLWHKNGKMIIALDLLGSIKGTVYLAGFPKYNQTTKELYFDQLSYVLDTKNKLMRTANWLAEGIILKKIEQHCRYSIKSNLEETQTNLMAYLKNYSPMPGVFINGKMQEIGFQKIQLTDQAIIAFIEVKGNVNISVNGLK